MTDPLKAGKKAVIYARVSTKGQADAGTSVETQLEVCRKWCKDNDVEIVGEYHDDGVSGTTNDREDFGQIIGAVVSKQPHYLVVYDSSRLTRSGKEELDRLKAVLELYRCEAIYAGMGGMSANSTGAIFMDAYKSTSDSLYATESTKKSKASIDRLISEGSHVSRSVTFAFAEDIPLMPEGRILYEPREREKKDAEGRIIKTVTPATVIKSVNDFFVLVDRGASIEVIAEMWGIERRALSDAVKGKTKMTREQCEIPNRQEEYTKRLKAAKESGNVDEVLLSQYLSVIRERKAKAREQTRQKMMAISTDGDKGSFSPKIETFDNGDKGVVG